MKIEGSTAAIDLLSTRSFPHTGGGSPLAAGRRLLHRKDALGTRAGALGDSIGGARLFCRVLIRQRRTSRSITRALSVAPSAAPMFAPPRPQATWPTGQQALIQGYPMHHAAVLPGTDVLASASSSPSLSLYSSASSSTSSVPVYRPAQIPPLDATLRQNEALRRTTCSRPSAGKEPRACCLVFAVGSRRDVHSPGKVN